MNTITKKSKVIYASGILIRPTFEGKDKLRLAAKLNNQKQGEIMRKLIDKGISKTGKILL